MQDLSKMDKEIAFKIKLQIALIWNAQRLIDVYPEKKSKFNEYIEERKNIIRDILKINHDEIWEDGKKLFDL
ncbi:MAG: hypothetical protein JHC29_02125 [Thermoplasmata archaeon]|jgi:hypothetical protein|nr:hypothetical protein [Thermoplasmata archaeon]MVT13214.1 hypothetical protein [Euryarchaeota archaeon]